MSVPSRTSRFELTYGTCETTRCSDWIRTSYPSSLRRFRSGLRASGERDIKVHPLLELDGVALHHGALGLVPLAVLVRHGVDGVGVLERVRERELHDVGVGDLLPVHDLRPG